MSTRITDWFFLTDMLANSWWYLVNMQRVKNSGVDVGARPFGTLVEYLASVFGLHEKLCFSSKVSYQLLVNIAMKASSKNELTEEMRDAAVDAFGSRSNPLFERYVAYLNKIVF